jgi:hypothetical protein
MAAKRSAAKGKSKAAAASAEPWKKSKCTEADIQSLVDL